MKEIEANQVISSLVASCGTWEPATVEAWVDEITQLSDVTAAQEATESVLKSWTRQGRPPFGVWHEAYLAHARRRRAEAEARQSAGEPAISLEEYLRRLAVKAEREGPSSWSWRELHEVWPRYRSRVEGIIGTDPD